MKIQILIASLCFMFGLAVGIFTEHRLNPIQIYDCEVIDYSKVESIVARQVASHQVQPLDVEKIKHVKSFTYAPIYSIQVTPQDSVLKQIINQAAILQPKPK